MRFIVCIFAAAGFATLALRQIDSHNHKLTSGDLVTAGAEAALSVGSLMVGLSPSIVTD